MTVGIAMLRLYWPIVRWFGLALVLVSAAGTIVLASFPHAQASLWLLTGATMVRYWLLVIGIILVSTQLRYFVANGVTRHEFLAAAACLGLVTAVAAALLVPIGHGLENSVLASVGNRGTHYPLFDARVASEEAGRALVADLAYFVSGGLFAAVFYRFSRWVGVALLQAAVVPMLAAQLLLERDDYGAGVTRFLPYGPAVLITLAAVIGGAVALGLALRDVAIPRAGG